MNQVAVQEVPKVQDLVSVTAHNLSKLRECKKSFRYDQMNIQYEGYERKRYTRTALYKTVEFIRSGGKNVREFVTEIFDKEYLQEWFSCKVQYDTLLERDRKRVLRIAEYIVNNGYEVLPGKEAYSLTGPFEINGCKVGKVEGKFDFLIKKDSKITAVLVKSGEPKYSVRARKEDNMPKYSIELLTAYLGSCDKYDKSNYGVALWYLKNKDDSGMSLADFEHREGKNIVSMDFSKLSKKELQDYLVYALDKKQCEDCSNCRHRCVCQMSSNVSHGTKVNKESKAVSQEKKYTKDQEKVIKFVNGQMCVVAVPGAGKTFSLVNRMLYLIRKGVHPSKILFLTFTKKAAKEIESRVKDELTTTGNTVMPTISTFNGFGYSILQENPMYVGRRIKLATDVDRYALIFKAISQCPYIKGVSYDALESEYGLIHTLDRLFEDIDEKGEKWFGETYADRKDVEGHLNVYHAYKKLYKKAGYINYAEQISIVNELFEKYPVLVKRYAEKYEYIMADEYQDSSEEQVEMLYSIARQHGNLVVVGDDDQSIYDWRNGSSKYMLEYKKDFPDATMVYMEDNFRSHQGILAASNALISNNGKRYEKNLKGHLGDLGKPILVKGVEKEYLKLIINTAMKKGYKAGEIAILARNNSRLEEVQSVLEGFVDLSSPKDYMIEDSVFLAIYDMLTLYYKGLDSDVALYRMFKYKKQEDKLNKQVLKDSFYQNLLNEELIYPIIKGEPECVQRYEMQEDDDCYLNVGKCIVRCFEKIYSEKIEIILHSIVKNVFGIDSHIVVDNLIDNANVRGIVKIRDLYDLMNDMILYNSKERVGYGVSLDAINLLTCHDAKGKEFKNVIIYGIEDFSEDEEEIRVLYVAMTRAIKNLFFVETSPNRYNTLTPILPYIKVIGGQ